MKLLQPNAAFIHMLLAEVLLLTLGWLQRSARYWEGGWNRKLLIGSISRSCEMHRCFFSFPFFNICTKRPVKMFVAPKTLCV